MKNDVQNLFAIAGMIAAYAMLRWAVDEMQNADASLKDSPFMRFALARRESMMQQEFATPEEETADGTD